MEREKAGRITEFWFGSARSDPAAALQRHGLWFGSAPAFDAEIRDRHAADVHAAASGALRHWCADAATGMALVLLLDQFPRNLWRGTARAFAHDALARSAARALLDAGALEALTPIECGFLILPLEHSEAIEDQAQSVELAERNSRTSPPQWQPLLERFAHYARVHRDIIDRFGRFPHRNAVLGRASTLLEIEYLRDSGADFGQKPAP